MNKLSYSCRSCGNTKLEMILSLGNVPLANALLKPDQLAQQESLYPLDLVFCPQCTLVQITETVPPATLFEEYLYFSSFSDTMLNHARELSIKFIDLLNLNSKSLVIELGSNDGYLLRYFVEKNIPVLGIEPAKNIAEVAQSKGIQTLCEFFGERLAIDLRNKGQSADVIIANNVLAHVADLNGFVEGIRILLKENGRAVIEVPYIKDMIDRCEFDTIYHEHLCYFSLSALDWLFRKHGMLIADVERIPIHGGSLRFYAALIGSAQPSKAVQLLLQEEKKWGVSQKKYYLHFGQEVEQVNTSLRSLLESLKKQGKHIAAYGAAAKGTILLNYCQIGTNFLDFAVDRSNYKQGHYIPGVRVPIYAPSHLLEAMPDYTLILAWNLATEIMEQQSEYRHKGGKFIIPIPKATIM